MKEFTSIKEFVTWIINSNEPIAVRRNTAYNEDGVAVACYKKQKKSEINK